MIQIHISVWRDSEGRDRFKVLAPDGDGMTDVTDQYAMVAIATAEGQPGFGIIKRAPADAAAPAAVQAVLADQGGS